MENENRNERTRMAERTRMGERERERVSEEERERYIDKREGDTKLQ